MSRAARLILVAVMLLAQFAVGEEVRLCVPAGPRTAVAASKPVCEKICCCPKGSHRTAKGERCEVKRSQQPVADTYVVPSVVTIPAILPLPLPAVTPQPVSVTRTTPPHLVVPRTRAPDIGEHPLRAPPSC